MNVPQSGVALQAPRCYSVIRTLTSIYCGVTKQNMKANISKRHFIMLVKEMARFLNYSPYSYKLNNNNQCYC